MPDLRLLQSGRSTYEQVTLLRYRLVEASMEAQEQVRTLNDRLGDVYALVWASSGLLGCRSSGRAELAQLAVDFGTPTAARPRRASQAPYTERREVLQLLSRRTVDASQGCGVSKCDRSMMACTVSMGA